jgi:30S ribosomal protein S31
MGKGDIKTGKGKRTNGSYGKTRLRKKATKSAPVAAAKPEKAAAEKKAPAVKKAAAAKPAAEKKPAAKKTTKKESSEATEE